MCVYIYIYIYIIFITVLFTIVKTWEQPKCALIDEWIKKLWCIYVIVLFSYKNRMKSCHLRQHRWTLRALAK